MNTPNKPLGEWTLKELKGWCSDFSCEDCPVGDYDGCLCQFGDCTPDKWELLNTPVETTETTPAETAPAPEPETDKPAKPFLAELLGVEVGERFAIKILGKEVSGFSVHEDGTFWQDDFSNLPADCLALVINHPDQIVRQPRLTEPELAICKTLGGEVGEYGRRGRGRSALEQSSKAGRRWPF